jgi:hypothetical protein
MPSQISSNGVVSRARSDSSSGLGYRAKRTLRRLGWLVVILGAAYAVVVLTSILRDPRW